MPQVDSHERHRNKPRVETLWSTQIGQKTIAWVRRRRSTGVDYQLTCTCGRMVQCPHRKRVRDEAWIKMASDLGEMPVRTLIEELLRRMELGEFIGQADGNVLYTVTLAWAFGVSEPEIADAAATIDGCTCVMGAIFHQ